MNQRSQTSAGRRPIALGLDLGSTRVKLGLLDAEGQLLEVRALPAPRPSGPVDSVRELDVDEYRAAAERLLADAPGDLPLGIASQRSSFVLWDRDGRPATPLVSWQDRSAHGWCAAREEELGAEVARRTGLVLSPHYAGPKLAARFERDRRLLERARAGELLFGTLETYLVWHWSGGAAHETDLSMAARTLLVDLELGGFSPELCERFGVPPAILPTIAPSAGRATGLARHELRASLADQPSGLVASLGADAGGALCNLGTGVFCLRPTGTERERREGYLCGPLLSTARDGTLWALEGTINGGGATADREAPGPTELPARDPSPEAFCLPDENGLGAPHWRARQPQHFSRPDRPGPERRRAVLEGLVFRAHAILEDLGAADEDLLVSGGLANEPFVPSALAAVLGRPVRVLLEEESTLLGAARLAAGLGAERSSVPATREVPPPPVRPEGAGAPDPVGGGGPGARSGHWLRHKSFAWRAWVDGLLGPTAG